MYFNEKLIPLSDGKFFAMSLFDMRMTSFYLPRDDQNQGYAYLSNTCDTTNQNKIDLRHLCAQNLEPDLKSAADFRNHTKKILETEQIFPTFHASHSEEQRIREQQDRYNWYAQQYEHSAFLYPSKVFFAQNGIGILSFDHRKENQIPEFSTWIVDVVHNKQISSTNEREAWLAISENGQNGLRIQMEPMGQNELAEFSSGLESVTELLKDMAGKDFSAFENMMPDLSQLKKQLNPTDNLEIISLIDSQVIGILPKPKFCRHYMSWEDNWVLIVKEMIQIYSQSGVLISEFPINGEVFDTTINSEHALCALSLLGGNILLVDLESGDQQLIRPHLGASPNSSVCAKIAHNGKYLISSLEGSVVVTDLSQASPVSCSLLKFESVTEHLGDSGSYVSTKQMYPDFAFLGDQIAILRDGAISLHNVPSVDQEWRHSIVEAKTPLTEEEATDKIANIKPTIIELGLERVAEQLEKLLVPSIRFDELGAPQEKMPLGCSRLGGDPDLADSVNWPEWSGAPMLFVGQFNLEKIAKIAPNSLLPKTGLLSLFIGWDQENEMANVPYENVKGNEWKIIHQPDISTLKTVPQTFSGYEAASLTAIAFHPVKPVLPAEDSVLIQALKLDDNEMEAYLELMEMVNGDEEEYYHEGTQLLGYPHTFQGNHLEYECQLESHGLNPHIYPEDQEEMSKLTEAAAQWSLLFQVGESEHSSIGLCEFVLYLFIPNEELKASNFDNVWLTCQC